MARRRNAAVLEREDAETDNEETTDTEEETTTDDAPAAPETADGGTDGTDGRVKVPTHLRALFNEVGRLSGILALARRGVYANDPARVVKALTLLESQAPAAREIAELSVT